MAGRTSRALRRTGCAVGVGVVALGTAGPVQAASPVKPRSKPGVLRAGAGQADITPPKLGYFLGGWTRADRLAKGQSTRLYANTLVLQRGTQKVALVAAELFAIPAGLQADVAKEVADLGYTRASVVMAASHTHSAPGGFANNPTYNTAAPSLQTITEPSSFVELLDPAPADRQLYTFLVRQIAASIRRADADRTQAAAAWGQAKLSGLTMNRSIEAHLRDHGITVAQGAGSAAQDPGGYEHTIDPQVDLLRVDKVVRHGRRTRRVPIGAWSSFANHGTVVKSETEAYSGDHHAAAWRVFADRVRKEAKVPKRQTVVNVYPNGAEGDQTAGLTYTGPAGAAEVGGREADAMLAAWRDAGKRLDREPALGLRWTNACFCGADTATGPVDATGKQGLGFLTGSEEGRGPLFELTRIPFEGVTSPIDDPVQGPKVVVPVGSPPKAVPVTVLRIGDVAIATIPGEPTKEVGVRVRAAVLDRLRGASVSRVAIAGLAGDFIQYVVTPEEYGAQSYEGASTLFGRNQATFLQERLADLAGALAAGAPAPEPFAEDPSYGVKPDGPGFSEGAASGRIVGQPAGRVERLGQVRLSWTGGGDGVDRPVDRAFVRAQRLVGKRWRTVDTDLGLHMLWRATRAGRYTLEWEVPADAPAGRYRLQVTASRYELTSDEFDVAVSRALRVEAARAVPGGWRVRLAFPPARAGVDLSARPEPVVVQVPDGALRRAGATVLLPAGAARDGAGNTTGVTVALGR
ncbi:neutral/alkaline non-lysosomal ceramidase N-terminal domain-containing protein [Conexibacter sp. SYSU D00693]|uniref:neutral/alkaline non-lysosomal ceramidase N-terminal domain-containing protein n=1 Tax=Conexibacter sp. SYSU D00693 TaxID=2812560 RepID=UPI00196AF2A6|nr:neutral/alkaline non-lysosomal ceramidase N-terminal domain-containing protein [Conexibacter sp. SYSU D00693]